MQNEKLKESRNLQNENNKRNEIDYDRRDPSGNQRLSVSRQTFGEKVQRFNKPLVGGNDEEEQFYPPNYQNEYPINPLHQKFYPQTPMQAMNQRKFGMYENPYNMPPNLVGNERELTGSSEMIMISKGMQKMQGNQQMYNQPIDPNMPHDNFGYKGYPMEQKPPMYNPGYSSMGVPPGMMYPPQMQTQQQMFGMGTFGTDPSMSMYAQRPTEYGSASNDNINSLNDLYMMNQKGEIDFLNDKLTKVQQMYDTLKKEYDEQKKFYDEALEARTNQLEEAENEATKAKSDLEIIRKNEIDFKSKNESLKFDNEMLSKRIETTSQDKSNASQREEGLLKQLDELNTALKQKESIIEQKVDENFGLKQTIDSIRTENDKLKKRIMSLEDLLRNKDSEITDYEKEMASARGEINTLINKEKGLMKENEATRNELGSVKNQLRGEQERGEKMLKDITNMKEGIGQAKHKEQVLRTAVDNLSKELDAIKNQLLQANNYIQTQDSQFRTLQKELEIVKGSNLELKSQLEQSKIQSFAAQQQLTYQPPAPQYRSPPQFEPYAQYAPPPQFNYNPPPHENTYSKQISYSPPHNYTQDYDIETSPKRQSWEADAPLYQSYNEPPYTPPNEEYMPPSRNKYSEGVSEKQLSHSLEFQPKGVSSGVEQAYMNKIHHNQSTMGSLLTWNEIEGEQNPMMSTPPRKAPPSQESSYQPQPRSVVRSGQEQPTQW